MRFFTLVPIALFASLSWRALGTRIGPFDSHTKAPPAERREKGYGDENGVLSPSSRFLPPTYPTHSPSPFTPTKQGNETT